ncbi:MAG: MTH1187 family thiamine-binding protein [Chloroflexota bacterium]
MNEHVIAEIAVCPIGTESTEVSAYVRGCIEIVKKAKDVKYEISSMGTNIEGTLPRILELLQEMHELPFTTKTKQILTTLKIDDRRDKLASMDNKVKKVS